MKTYVVPQDERLDRICKNVLGTEKQQVVEAVLSANPGLGKIASKVPLGTVVVFPDLQITSTPIRKTIRLWGES